MRRALCRARADVVSADMSDEEVARRLPAFREALAERLFAARPTAEQARREPVFVRPTRRTACRTPRRGFLAPGPSAWCTCFREKQPTAPSFFRAGVAGQWRSVLQAAQVQAVVDAHGDAMERFGYLPEVPERC